MWASRGMVSLARPVSFQGPTAGAGEVAAPRAVPGKESFGRRCRAALRDPPARAPRTGTASKGSVGVNRFGVGVPRRDGFAGREEVPASDALAGTTLRLGDPSQVPASRRGSLGRVRRGCPPHPVVASPTTGPGQGRISRVRCKGRAAGIASLCSAPGAAYGPRVAGEGDDRRRPGRHVRRTSRSSTGSSIRRGSRAGAGSCWRGVGEARVRLLGGCCVASAVCGLSAGGGAELSGPAAG